MFIKCCDSFDDMSKVAAELVIEAVNKKPDMHLGLTAGATPVGLYDYLVAAYEENRVSFAKTHFYNLEEMSGLSKDDPLSCYQYFKVRFFDKTDAKIKNLLIPDGTAIDRQKECDAYEEILSNLPDGCLDLQIMGIGGNGHIGCNEPADELIANCHEAFFNPETMEGIYEEYGEDGPRSALAMGVGDILRSKMIIMVASGQSKVSAVKEMLSGKITAHCPATLLQLHSNAYIIVDNIIAEAIK